MKLRLSTKMIGETLEQHCEAEFNKLRATAFSKRLFLKKTMIQGLEVRVILSIGKQMKQIMKLFQ